MAARVPGGTSCAVLAPSAERPGRWCLPVRLLCLIGLCIAARGRAADFQSVGLYQSFDELVGWADDFAAANADIVQVVEFGRSYQQRALISLQLSIDPGRNDPRRPEFLFTGGLHAREVIGSEAAYRLAEQLVSGYRSGDPAFREILTEREVWIVPNLNPDGRVRVEGGYSRQRKTMELCLGQDSSNYTRGIDLNRNFPHRWSEALSSVRTETYGGPAVLSTPEASALWSLLDDSSCFSDLRASIDFHSGADAVLSPWISPSDFHDNPLPPDERTKFDFLAGRMSQLTGLTNERLSYDSYGTLVDSLYEEFGTYALLAELYSGPFPDYFTLFNPLDRYGIDDAVDKAVVSSLFLLSDEAFLIVPEPSLPALLSSSAVALLAWVRRQRHRGWPQ